jgi:hypothetical protein
LSVVSEDFESERVNNGFAKTDKSPHSFSCIGRKTRLMCIRQGITSGKIDGFLETEHEHDGNVRGESGEKFHWGFPT